jgi:hypothetical protein
MVWTAHSAGLPTKSCEAVTGRDDLISTLFARSPGHSWIASRPSIGSGIGVAGHGPQMRRQWIAIDKVGEQMVDIGVAVDHGVDRQQRIAQLMRLLVCHDFARRIQMDEQPLAGFDIADEEGIHTFPGLTGFAYRKMRMRLDDTHWNANTHVLGTLPCFPRES